MKERINFKKIAAAFMLTAGVLSIPVSSQGDEIVKIFGQNNLMLGTYPATSVSHIEFGEGTSIEIPLSETVSFKMIKVEGGVPYTLQNTGINTASSNWQIVGTTKQMEDYWIGEFLVTQGIWKEVMGISSDDKLPVSNVATNFTSGISVPKGSKQTAIGNNYPIANVSWDDICGTDGFLTKINEKLKELKASDATLAAALGDREFRLPDEWEWEYAASGGKDYATLKYYYAGTTANTVEALEQVAVNSVSPNSVTSVAVVGSKVPNALGLYDMSGNVYEWCSGKYPNLDVLCYLYNDGTVESSRRPNRGGNWGEATASYFSVFGRNSNTSSYQFVSSGFRLAL
ncbi:MAG: formylglycine-generating enzyme family protein [Bacteroidales bacterium]|nr:formylglycine-generating enzyme family protein [Bacteroidales bacterium]